MDSWVQERSREGPRGADEAREGSAPRRTDTHDIGGAAATAAAVWSEGAAAWGGSNRRASGGGRGPSGGRAFKGSPPERPPRPTHFLALRLSHVQSVTDAIQRVQTSLRRYHPSLEDFLEAPVKAHLTLMVMALAHGSPHPQPHAHRSLAAAAPVAPDPEPSAGVPAAEALVPEPRTISGPKPHGRSWGSELDPPAPAAPPISAAHYQQRQRQPGFWQQQQQRDGPQRQHSGAGLPWRLVHCLRRMAELPAALQDAAVDGPLPLELRGLGAFGSRVLFLEVRPDGEEGQEGGKQEEQDEEVVVVEAVGAGPAATAAGAVAATQLGASTPATTSATAAEATAGVGGHVGAAAAAAAVAAAAAGGGGGPRARLMRLQEAVAAHFRDLRFDESERPFAPHVTIAKVTYRPPWARAGGGGGRGGRGRRGGRGGRVYGYNDRNRHGGAGEEDEQEEAPLRGAADQPGPQDVTAAAAEAANMPVATAAAAVTSFTDEYGNRIIDVQSAALPSAVAAPAHTPLHRRSARQQEQHQHQLPLHPREEVPQQPLNNIPPAAYQEHLDIDAGLVVVDRVQLCAMGGRTPGQYYSVLAEVLLGVAAEPGGDRAEVRGAAGRGGGGGGGGGGAALQSGSTLRRHPLLPPWMLVSDEALEMLTAAADAEAGVA